MVAWMVLSSQMYFVHFSAMRLAVVKGIHTGLEQFVMWNTDSFIMTSGVGTGWTFFWGLAALFVAFIFTGSRLELWLRYLNLTFGVCSIAGTFGSLFENGLLEIFYHVGTTVIGLIISVLMIVLFKRLSNRAA